MATSCKKLRKLLIECDMKKLPGREEIIKSYMEEYRKVEMPRI